MHYTYIPNTYMYIEQADDFMLIDIGYHIAVFLSLILLQENTQGNKLYAINLSQKAKKQCNSTR